MNNQNDNDLTEQAGVDFGQRLQQEAAAFRGRTGSRKHPNRQFIVADFEYIYDDAAFRAYQIAEDDSTKGLCRWPFHRIVAGAWCMLTLIDGFANPIVTNLKCPTGIDEQTIVTDFFGLCQTFPDAPIVTFGGENKDIGALRRTAMEYGLSLPPQFLDSSPFGRMRVDLANAIRGTAAYVHLPEISAAIGIDSKPMPSREIGRAVQYAQWEHVQNQVLADLCTISKLAWRWLIMTEFPSGCVPVGDLQIAQALSANFPDNDWLRRQVDLAKLAA